MDYKRIAVAAGFLVTLNVLFQNCAKKALTNEGSTATAQAVTQAKSVDLLNQKCSACHSGEAAYANAIVGQDPITDVGNVEYLLKTRLVVPGEPDLSPLFLLIQSGEMPPGQPLPLDEVNMIKDWIANYNTIATPVGTGIPAPTPLSATYTSLRTNVFLSKCYGCHVNRPVMLDTFASVSGAIAGNNLRGRVNANTMPPPGAAQLSVQEKTILLQWIDAGAMNN